jgi:hypothetical protein
MFVSSDHSETQISNTTYGSSAFIVASYTVCQVLSVNRAGSVPPVAADLLPGATVAVGGSGVAMVIDALCPVYYYGMNFVFTGTIVNGISFSSGGSKSHYFDTCQIYINTTVASAAIFANNPAVITLYNSSIRFGHTSQFIRGGGNNQSFEINWLNTSSPFGGGVVPAVLFNPQAAKFLVTARGVDFSALNTIMVQEQTSSTVGQGGKFLFDSCRIASGVTRYSTANMGNCTAVVELVNCYDGTSFLSETHQPTGDVTTEFTITLSGGAQDNVGTFSHKMVSNTNIDKYANTLTSFWMDTNNATIGGPRTATVEFISSASLNNDEISLLLEYEGTAGSSLASIVTTMPATVLTTPTAVPTSTATWNSSPATPVRQHLQVTFTPQVLGRVRGQIRLGKPSTTVYVDPRLILT